MNAIIAPNPFPVVPVTPADRQALYGGLISAGNGVYWARQLADSLPDDDGGLQMLARHRLAYQGESEPIYVLWSVDGQFIRKWSRKPFEQGSPVATVGRRVTDREALAFRLERIIDDGGPLTLSDKAALREILACLIDQGEAHRPATVEDHNAAFDSADEALGGAFRDGFREGWIYVHAPDGHGYDEWREQYGRAVDYEPSEAWQAHRDKYFAMLPLAAIPEVGDMIPAASTSKGGR